VIRGYRRPDADVTVARSGSLTHECLNDLNSGRLATASARAFYDIHSPRVRRRKMAESLPPGSALRAVPRNGFGSNPEAG